MPNSFKNRPNHAVFSTSEWSRLARKFGLADLEINIAKAMIDEKSDQQISSELGVTNADVDVHRADVLRKTQARSSVTLLLALFGALRRTPEPRAETL